MPNQIKNLTKEDIIGAIKVIDKKPELIRGRQSVAYDLLYDSEIYPPILVLSEANKLQDGSELTIDDFGGTEKAFGLLKRLSSDFIIKPKENKFSYVKYFQTLGKALLPYRNKQRELISILKKIGNDKNLTENDGSEITEIDPFTFFAFFMKIKDEEKRKLFFRRLKHSIPISVPTPDSFAGAPSANAMMLWYFPYKDIRKPDDISTLWDLAEQAISGNIKNQTFQRALQIYAVKTSKLTQGLFYVDPEKYYPIDSHSVYIEQKGINTDVQTIEDYNRVLKEIKQKFTKPFYEISYEAWLNDQEDTSIVQPNSNRRYWIYAPGPNAELWDEFYEDGIIALGWDHLGDLKQYNTKEDIEEKLIKLDQSKGRRYNDASANYEFVSLMSIGDMIIVKRGMYELIGYGEVISDYYFDDDRESYKSCRKVKWLRKGRWETDHQLVQKTLTNVTTYNSGSEDYSYYYERLLDLMGEFKRRSHDPISIFKHPLNKILYGPPGTGKTYYSVLYAAQIIQNRVITDYQKALEIFNTNLGDRIEFITFHQNYSYEDFIQGLRPDTNSDSDLRFEKKDGVFKKICDRALENLKQSEKAPEEISKEFLFDVGLKSFIDEVLETDGNYKINDTAFIYEVDDDAFRYRGEQWQNAKPRMKFADLKQFYIHDVQSRKDVKKLSTISGLANQHATYYFLVYKQILKHIPNANNIQYPTKVQRQNYVIIIDEINRANISRVFGELITLIEPDKRSAGSIPLTVTLPSGDKFQVPSNLYIIGTMNTADKSIALLDIALRRRFEFEAMYPKTEIAGIQIHDTDILNAINHQIVESKGHDFQIGHSYFISTMDDPYNRAERMNKKIIPLLLEYYMNDKQEVLKILKGSGLEIDETVWPLQILDHQ